MKDAPSIDCAPAWAITSILKVLPTLMVWADGASSKVKLCNRPPGLVQGASISERDGDELVVRAWNSVSAEMSPHRSKPDLNRLMSLIVIMSSPFKSS